MKKSIHPETYPAIFVDTSCGAEFFTMTTLKGEKTKTVKDVEYQIIPVEISSASHPFYTGKQVLIDTARRVEKFEETMKKVGNAAAARKGKKAKKAKADAKKESKKAAKTKKVESK